MRIEHDVIQISIQSSQRVSVNSFEMPFTASKHRERLVGLVLLREFAGDDPKQMVRFLKMFCIELYVKIKNSLKNIL